MPQRNKEGGSAEQAEADDIREGICTSPLLAEAGTNRAGIRTSQLLADPSRSNRTQAPSATGPTNKCETFVSLRQPSFPLPKSESAQPPYLQAPSINTTHRHTLQTKPNQSELSSRHLGQANRYPQFAPEP
jgi:hypothetical protein